MAMGSLSLPFAQERQTDTQTERKTERGARGRRGFSAGNSCKVRFPGLVKPYKAGWL